MFGVLLNVVAREFLAEGGESLVPDAAVLLEPLTDVDRWLEEYRGIWDERFAALREELARDDVEKHAEHATDEGKTS